MNTRYEKYKEQYAKYRKEHKGEIREWNKSYRAKNKKAMNLETRKGNNFSRFGIKEDKPHIIKMLGGKCAKCGILDADHKIKYGRSLNVHHKDGIGRDCPTPNNNRGNLVLLCHPCHIKEHKIWPHPLARQNEGGVKL